MRELVEQGIEIDGKRYHQPYDLILPESSLKGTAPAQASTSGTPPTWNERRRVRLSLYYRLIEKLNNSSVSGSRSRPS
jgi:hypothetical protein